MNDESLYLALHVWLGIASFSQENLQLLFALGNFREVEGLLSALCLSCSRSGPASNDFCRFLLMKCGCVAVASVVAVQRGEITMSVDHIWLKPKRGLESQDSAV